MYKSGAKLQFYFRRMVLLAAMLPLVIISLGQHKVTYVIDDSASRSTLPDLQSQFRSRFDAYQHIQKLPSFLQAQGYIAASVDSVRSDSLNSFVLLFLGRRYQWQSLQIDSADRQLVFAAGYDPKSFTQKQVDLRRLESAHKNLLEYLENSGYPFARVYIDSLDMNGDQISGKLKIDKGPLYKIDSVRNLGSARISADFLQRYLALSPGSIFQKNKLAGISSRLQELPYLRETKPWDLTLLGTGSILNLYLENRKSSQVNVLVGLLPSTQQSGGSKMQVTGEANISLRNALGSGELISANWQQIQVKSPRLNLQYQHPYLFRSPFGVNFGFDLFKKDSSFVNINLLLGATYSMSARHTGSLFVQSWSSNLLTVDTMQVKFSRRLPEQADISSIQLGLTYELAATDYRFNPRKGTEMNLTVSAGTRQVKVNNIIAGLTDDFDPSFRFSTLYDSVKERTYQFRLRGSAAHYFPLGKVSTLKAAINAGWIQSPNIFRNELFQLGGYKLLRGFDEESEFASGYIVMTAEYRFLLGRNSFLFGFADGGVTKNDALESKPANRFIGIGAGMAFETKAGIFNLSLAVGKRNETSLNFRQSKIHLGYVNYF